MTTAADHQQRLHDQIAVQNFDPDETVPRGSPLMKAQHPNIHPCPSPPPDIPPAQVSSSPPPVIADSKRSNGPKIRPSPGDRVLLEYLGAGRHPDVARNASSEALPGIDAEAEHEGEGPDGSTAPRKEDDDCPLKSRSGSSAPTSSSDINGPSLQHLAADALQVVSPDSQPIELSRDTSDIAWSTGHLSLADDRTIPLAVRLPKRLPGNNANPERSCISSSIRTPLSSDWPPLQMDSPKAKSNSQILPSMWDVFGPMPSHIPTDKESVASHGSGAPFTRSPTETLRRLPPIPTSQKSSPASQLSHPSPHSVPASSPYIHYTSNSFHQRTSTDYGTSLPSDTPSTEQTPSTPATALSVAERMSIDGITNPLAGQYVCRYQGCKAQAFQTQYLLNSHANVHSSARPHYCPVPNCPRSEGGKGFKRKNEMIRHGLVHASPGYICPFCPDREHKYPRPDNLQRHVRVHHVDKAKDDPLLREVLSQRPDGPNRGRRRRGIVP
ncbi:hypothetical protein E4U41_007116 [Claviceps citrina]|nr:hypothetical protein E4U41_007116 [Claviceps citrina]